MIRMSATFLILSAITLIGACAAMMLRGLVHCALAVAIAFAGLGTLYLNLGAQFLGLAQLLVYVGAIAVLIVFVILLTRGGESDATLLSQVALRLTGFWGGARLFVALSFAGFLSLSAHLAGATLAPAAAP